MAIPTAVNKTRSTPTNAVMARPERRRMEFVDGLRGLAALYVVFHHVYHQLNWKDDGGGLPHSVLRLTKALAYGHFAVGVFIVLSGYCLMLPVARSVDGRLRGGFKEYIQRRARRILPPYYAALALILLLIAITPALQRPADAHWDAALPALTTNAIGSHLLLIYNFWPTVKMSIDPPMWSVATEWQIYFALPWLLLPVWRRFGNMAMLAVAFLVAWAPIYLRIPVWGAITQQADWTFLSSFALGMLGAQIAVSRRPRETAWREKLPWGAIALLLALGMAASAVVRPGLLMKNLLIGDTLVGIAVMALLIHCTRVAETRQGAGGSPALTLLQSRPVVALGAFSYSLYLIHFPILALIHAPLRAMHLAPLTRFCILLGVAAPLAVLAAYLFHLAFERRFLSTAPKARPAG
jgi:peptidoglycan/LPS O-acetylase OafA/YrhL